ncbi:MULTISPECIES: arabinose-5-phosphate isomerase GutQ [unclassified Brenneria]|uniref:arabinose-5-phosphate isomerase GutQ n=1 Tax=unclassified Brenneria TaxID=2634434 RepID=UPI0029C57DBA|nr:MULTISPECIES: arabinose-5-phosphate isomerase GutQ [unclassified Brenneria]MDX5629433.1 arabinose-5-phosphate isomerase GutQ [Brenneria sp. L3-3Z]MDX5696572.1 arabinose-5-phosphate isomerase GutQ [Brenneria sp. L4-2C]
MNERLLTFARETLEIEITEAQRMLERLDTRFVDACKLLLECAGKVVVSGMGKSGHIGKKIAASLASTGTPAFFVHPAEALHGDLGMIGPQDVVIFISYSGRAQELNVLLPLLAESRIPVIALTGNAESPLGLAASCVLDVGVTREACPMGLAPTSSAVNTLMMGDALAMALMRHRGFSAEQFARSHPGGSLGARLLNRVHHIMRSGDRLPRVEQTASVMDAMLELSRTGLGLIVVCDDENRVAGVFTDGDLRRWLVKGNALDTVITRAMTSPGYQLPAEWRAAAALEALHEQHISAAPVVDSEGKLVGAINLHDLHAAGVA